MQIYNPATGRNEFVFIPTKSEVNMGKNIHASVLRSYRLSGDTKKAEHLQKIGQRLVPVSDRQDYAYNFYLIENEELNAFTTPGGNIYFHTGLYDRLGNDDAIAAVIAHEMGHCAARHTVKRFEAALGFNILSAIIFSQIEMDDDTRKTATLTTGAITQLIFAAYSRKDEYQADALGLKYMYLAGYNPAGMIETFTILKEESKGPKIPLILRTHPYLDDRIKAVNTQIPLLTEMYAFVEE